jgi:hypothetical protein
MENSILLKIKEGDLIQFVTCSNFYLTNKKPLTGKVELKKHLGLITNVNGIQYELRRLMDIEIIKN